MPLMPEAVALEEFEADNPRQLPKLRYELILPEPPSVNRLWKRIGHGKIIREPAYESWLRCCDGCALEQIGGNAYRRAIPHKYAITLTLDCQRFGKIDQDNCIKAASDFMQRARLVQNDRYAWRTLIVWGEVDYPQMLGPNCRVNVEAC